MDKELLTLKVDPLVSGNTEEKKRRKKKRKRNKKNEINAEKEIQELYGDLGSSAEISTTIWKDLALTTS